MKPFRQPADVERRRQWRRRIGRHERVVVAKWPHEWGRFVFGGSQHQFPFFVAAAAAPNITNSPTLPLIKEARATITQTA
jgi:hypothetical protein